MGGVKGCKGVKNNADWENHKTVSAVLGKNAQRNAEQAGCHWANEKKCRRKGEASKK